MSSPEMTRDYVLASLSLGRELGTATLAFHSAVAEWFGLNPTDHKALYLINEEGALTAGQLAERLDLTTGAITGVVDRLEKAGFVRREPDPKDRRRVILRVIPERGAEMAALFEPLGRALTELGSQYSDEELAVITDYLTRTTEILLTEAARLRSEMRAAE